MPFYKATGRDLDTLEPKSIQISARSEFEAIDTAAMQGMTDIKLQPYSDHDVLMMDFKCFLNADSKPIQRRRPERIRPTETKPLIAGVIEKEQVASELRSLLLRHPIPTVAIAVLIAIWIDRGITMLVSMF
tara:strand:- start:930 stop:1322 length:393 start_codon:yes stop_codon:yes gene_type:complete